MNSGPVSAPDHNALSVMQFSANKLIYVLKHLSYSPGPNSCDFSMFSKVKGVLNRTHFQSVEEVNATTVGYLKRVTGDELRHCSMEGAYAAVYR